jgi:hypothetical protein
VANVRAGDRASAALRACRPRRGSAFQTHPRAACGHPRAACGRRRRDRPRGLRHGRRRRLDPYRARTSTSAGWCSREPCAPSRRIVDTAPPGTPPPCDRVYRTSGTCSAGSPARGARSRRTGGTRAPPGGGRWGSRARCARPRRTRGRLAVHPARWGIRARCGRPRRTCGRLAVHPARWGIRARCGRVGRTCGTSLQFGTRLHPCLLRPCRLLLLRPSSCC